MMAVPKERLRRRPKLIMLNLTISPNGSAAHIVTGIRRKVAALSAGVTHSCLLATDAAGRSSFRLLMKCFVFATLLLVAWNPKAQAARAGGLVTSGVDRGTQGDPQGTGEQKDGKSKDPGGKKDPVEQEKKGPPAGNGGKAEEPEIKKEAESGDKTKELVQQGKQLLEKMDQWQKSTQEFIGKQEQAAQHPCDKELPDAAKDPAARKVFQREIDEAANKGFGCYIEEKIYRFPLGGSGILRVPFALDEKSSCILGYFDQAARIIPVGGADIGIKRVAQDGKNTNNETQFLIKTPNDLYDTKGLLNAFNFHATDIKLNFVIYEKGGKEQVADKNVRRPRVICSAKAIDVHIHSQLFCGIIVLITLGIFYFLIALGRAHIKSKHFSKEGERETAQQYHHLEQSSPNAQQPPGPQVKNLPVTNDWWNKVWHMLNPLELTATGVGHASLANLLMLFYTFLVGGLLMYRWMLTGSLSDLSDSLLYLLGIKASGSAGAKLSSFGRSQLDDGDRDYLTLKGWFSGARLPHEPALTQLLTTGGRFDIFKIQVILFSTIIAGYVITSGVTDLGAVHISSEMLSLMGISELFYVGAGTFSATYVTDLHDNIKQMALLEGKLRESNITSLEWYALEKAYKITAGRAAITFQTLYRLAVDEEKQRPSVQLNPGGSTPAPFFPNPSSNSPPATPQSTPPVGPAAAASPESLQPLPNTSLPVTGQPSEVVNAGPPSGLSTTPAGK